MQKKAMRMIEKHERGVAVGMAIMLVGIGGCATDASRGVPPISQDQVREHSEQAFDKLKQEEKNRAAGSAVGPQ